MNDILNGFIFRCGWMSAGEMDTGGRNVLYQIVRWFSRCLLEGLSGNRAWISQQQAVFE